MYRFSEKSEFGDFFKNQNTDPEPVGKLPAM